MRICSPKSPLAVRQSSSGHLPSRVSSTGVRFLVSIAFVAAGCTGQAVPSADSAEVEELSREISLLREQLAELTETTPPTTSTTSVPVSETSVVVASTTTTSTDPAISVLLRSYEWGESSDEVAELQRQIGATPDGDYGPRTREAHLEALEAMGLATEGVPSPPAAPAGGLIFERCGDCGQGFPSGPCANWTVFATNSSDVTVTSFTFSPPSGHWWERASGYGDSANYVAASAPPRTLTVGLSPYQSAQYTFQICTDTPSPGAGWEYGMLAPRSISFVWANGARGATCYNLGCY